MKFPPLLRAALWFISVYTFALGLLLNGPPSWVAAVGSILLDFDQAIDPPLAFAVRMMGAYMMFFGLAVGLTAWNPHKNRAVLSVAALFLIVRILQRAFYAAELQTTFGITPARNATFIGIMALFTLLLLLSRLLIYRQMHPRST